MTPSGTLSIVAGDGSLGPATPGPATSSPLGYADGVAVGSAGGFYIGDPSNSEVEQVTPAAPTDTTPPPTTSAPAAPAPTPQAVTTTPASTTPTIPLTTPRLVPVGLRITGIAVTATTIGWCQRAGCPYPASRLRFALNRATTVRVLLRALVHGHWKQVAATKLHGHRGANSDRIAGRWHGHLFPVGAVQILV